MRWLLTLGMLFAPPHLAWAQQPGWVGKTILVKTANIKIGYTEDGKQVFIAELDSIDYRVLTEENGWIRVKTRHGVSGWFDKEDAVLLENAIGYYTGLLKQDPYDLWAYNARAVAWRLKGSPDFAIKDYDALVQFQPSAAVYNNRGNAWRDKKEYDKAIADYTESLRLNPNFVLAVNNRGAAWINKKNYDKAIADLGEAIRLDPQYGRAYTNRGLAWFMKKQYDKALADFDRGDALSEPSSWLHQNRAMLLATAVDGKYRNGKKAVEQAKKALELEKIPAGETCEALAAAYAETGDFDEAVRWQTRALEDPQLTEDAEARQRLALYRDGKPYRQR